MVARHHNRTSKIKPSQKWFGDMIWVEWNGSNQNKFIVWRHKKI